MGNPSTPSSSLKSNNTQNPSPEASVEIQEDHPHETNIEIASLNVNQQAQTELSKPRTILPEALTKLFKTQYFKLYRPLEKWQEKALLYSAVILSIAAGVPLPIIGYISGYVPLLLVEWFSI